MFDAPWAEYQYSVLCNLMDLDCISKVYLQPRKILQLLLNTMLSGGSTWLLLHVPSGCVADRCKEGVEMETFSAPVRPSWVFVAGSLALPLPPLYEQPSKGAEASQRQSCFCISFSDQEDCTWTQHKSMGA
jgi:hypothetical protein